MERSCHRMKSVNSTPGGPSVTKDEYFAARDALQKLVEERTRLFRGGIHLDEFRRWLGNGVGTRWAALEGVIQRARALDLPLAMWWEEEWRGRRHAGWMAEQKARKRAKQGSAAPLVTAGPRRFEPGLAWRSP